MEGTLSSLIIVKLNLPESKALPCYEFQPPKTLLRRLKLSSVLVSTSYLLLRLLLSQ